MSNEKKETMDRWYELAGEEIEDLEDRQQVQEKIWEGVLEKTDERNRGVISFERKRWWVKRSVAAAVMLLLTGVVAYLYFDRQDILTEASLSSESERVQWIEKKNTTGGSKEVLLSDGSRIVLEPGSIVRYPEVFATDSRVVHMTGEAFFEVAKETGRPFLTYVGDVHVRVLGTSFTVKQIEAASATEVAVITGKVMVEKAKNKSDSRKGGVSLDNKLVLTPNKKVTFFKDSDHYITGLVDNPVIVERSEDYIKPDAFDFDEVPLREILGKLERAYGVSVTVSDDKVLDCLLTADLTSDNLYGKIELISAILDARYEITGNSILLSDCVCSVLEK